MQAAGRGLPALPNLDRHRLGLQVAKALSKASRQIDGSSQQAQIMASRNLRPAKLLQMRREPLRIEQDELARTQMFYERHERNLGCIGYAVKH